MKGIKKKEERIKKKEDGTKKKKKGVTMMAMKQRLFQNNLNHLPIR